MWFRKFADDEKLSFCSSAVFFSVALILGEVKYYPSWLTSKARSISFPLLRLWYYSLGGFHQWTPEFGFFPVKLSA